MDKLLLVTASFSFLLDIRLALSSWPSWLSLWNAGWDMPPCLSVFSYDTSIQVYKPIMTTFLSYKLIRDLQKWTPNLIILVLTAASDLSRQGILGLGLVPHQKVLKPLPLHLVTAWTDPAPIPHDPFQRYPWYFQPNRCQPIDTCRKTAAEMQHLVICTRATFSQSVLIHSLRKGGW